jgi:hypothetical protein
MAMKRLLLLSLLCIEARAQIVAPTPATCGPEIDRRAVMVLDVESFAGQPEQATTFIEQHVKGFAAATDKAETIVTPRAGTKVDRKDALELAQKTAAKRGCNVAIVLKAWTESSGRSAVLMPSPTVGLSAPMLLGYANVLFGKGAH